MALELLRGLRVGDLVLGFLGPEGASASPGHGQLAPRGQSAYSPAHHRPACRGRRGLLGARRSQVPVPRCRARRPPGRCGLVCPCPQAVATPGPGGRRSGRSVPRLRGAPARALVLQWPWGGASAPGPDGDPRPRPPGRLRALLLQGVVRGARAHAPLLLGEEDLHRPHPPRPEQLRQRHPARHRQPAAGPAAEPGAGAAAAGGEAGTPSPHPTPTPKSPPLTQPPCLPPPQMGG